MPTSAARGVAGVFFPLDERWGLKDSIYSPGMAKQMVWLSALLPYEKAEQVFKRIGHCVIPRNTIWRQSQMHSERLRAHLVRKQDRVRVERVVLPPPGQDHWQRKGISIDGGMVNIRGEGWKEVKVGAIGDIEQDAEWDPQSQEEVPAVRVRNVGYAAVLGSPEVFGPAMWALAVEKEVPQAADTCVTADGAPWIWNLTADLFPDSVQVVDWYHGCQHLAAGAHALYPGESQKAERCFKQWQNSLYLGEIQTITDRLDQADLQDHSKYFYTHQRRMRYQEFCEDGYPIGSGTVESGIKQFKARLSGPGMRWSRPGAEQMLVLRGAVMGDTFDVLWATA